MKEDIRKTIKVTLTESRIKDAWFDFGTRELREGMVCFYKATDALTGDWLFKTCVDEAEGKIIIKALKCPPGKAYTQMEGSTMIFQKSILKEFVYDIISLTYANEDDRIRREVISELDQVPSFIKENFDVKKYDEATGKSAIGKNLVTIVQEKDIKSMIILFPMERAWPMAQVPPETGLKEGPIKKMIEEAEKASIDEIYSLASDRLGMAKDEVDKLLDLLKSENKVIFPSSGYVKTVR